MSYAIALSLVMASRKKKTTVRSRGVKSCPPDEMLEYARQEPGLIDYWPVVQELRRKEFSWREISAWMAQGGVNFHYKRLERLAAEMAKKPGAEAKKGI